jgi:ketosteroid isomerase-like protein
MKSSTRPRDTAWAMSEENVEIVRRAIEAWGRRDTHTSLDPLMSSLDPDIEWVPVQDDPEYSVRRGHDDVRAWLTSWAEAFPDLRWELDRILDAGNDLVVAFVRLAGRSDATGIDLESPSYAVLFTLRGEKIARIHEYLDSQEALEAAGLSE